MPSPVGHALAGLALHAIAARDHQDFWDARRLALVVCAAGAPDLDLLWQWVDGHNHHQAQSHGVGSALLAGLLVAGAARLAGTLRWQRLGLACGAAWLSHVVLDFLNADASLPIGLMALWPFDAGYYKSQWPVLLAIDRTGSWAALGDNALAVAWECVLLGPLVAAAVRRWHRRCVLVGSS